VWRIAVALIACLLCIGRAGAENLSSSAFTAAFAAAAATAMPEAKVQVVGDLHLQTRGADGKSTDTDLHNAYKVYLDEPGRLDVIIRRYVGLLADTVHMAGVSPPVDRSQIVPMLKPNIWATTLQEQRKSAPATLPLTEPYNSELIIAYAEDRPSSIRYLMMRDDVGDRAQLRMLALANLHRLLPKIEMRAGADGIFLISAGGQYEASLLLADEIWSSGQIKVDGDIVAAVPAKDALFVTGSHNTAGLARLGKIAAELARAPYALTPVLFVYRDNKFVVFDGK
jgi:uncharacterized protein YtpQ (UPF0354 family)